MSEEKERKIGPRRVNKKFDSFSFFRFVVLQLIVFCQIEERNASAFIDSLTTSIKNWAQEKMSKKSPRSEVFFLTFRSSKNSNFFRFQRVVVVRTDSKGNVLNYEVVERNFDDQTNQIEEKPISRPNFGTMKSDSAPTFIDDERRSRRNKTPGVRRDRKKNEFPETKLFFSFLETKNSTRASRPTEIENSSEKFSPEKIQGRTTFHSRFSTKLSIGMHKRESILTMRKRLNEFERRPRKKFPVFDRFSCRTRKTIEFFSFLQDFWWKTIVASWKTHRPSKRNFSTRKIATPSKTNGNKKKRIVDQDICFCYFVRDRFHSSRWHN